MKKRIGLHIKWKTWLGTFVLLAALVVGLSVNSFVSLADSTGKITASSAKIRKEPSTSSETVGSAVQDAKVSVSGQITGSDGYTWYKVTVDGGTVGYIRSDLMEITDGNTPATVVAPTTTTSTPTTSTPDETLVDVADLEPVSANVKGSSPVRVRQNASTTSRIVTNAEGGMALTVIGKATGADNKEWYLVQFIANGSEVSGFIRADYVNVSGELVPAGSVVEEPVEEKPEEPKEEPEETAKAWETYYTEEDGKWHLVDNTTKNSYDIAQIFSSVEANTKTLQNTLKENKTQQIIIVALVILLIVVAMAVVLLFFKMKDLADSAYYNEVEQETLRRRTADRPVSQSKAGQRPTGTQGSRPAGQRPTGAQGGRPAGQRPTGAQGSRPAGQRPTGAQGGRPAGQRPAGAQGGKPAGQRPAGAQGSRPAGQRPAGAQGSRPAGQRPAGAQGSRPANQHLASDQVSQQQEGAKMTGQRPAGTQGNRPATQRPVQRQTPVQESTEEMVQNIFTDDTVVYDRADIQQAVRDSEQATMAAEQIRQEENAGWQSKNFVNEDELEFHFLNLEGDKK